MLSAKEKSVFTLGLSCLVREVERKFSGQIPGTKLEWHDHEIKAIQTGTHLHWAYSLEGGGGVYASSGTTK